LHLAEKIEKILKEIRPNKFVAIVTDNVSNCAATRNIINEKYPFIFNNHCIAHCVNLITKDVLSMFILIVYMYCGDHNFHKFFFIHTF
jgi:hypothetical protein